MMKSVVSSLSAPLLLALVATTGCGSDSTNGPSADAGPGIVDGNTNPDGGDGATTDAGPGEPGVPVTIGEGSDPGVALDAAGTAYIAWYGPEANKNTLQFCRIARAGTACDERHAIPALGESLQRPFVTVDGATVRVVSHRYGLVGDRFEAIYVFTSTDQGKTFDAGRQIGSVPFSDAIVGPGDAISFITNAFSAGAVYEHAPSNGTAPPAQRAILSSDHPYSGAVALLDATTPIAVFANGSGDAQLRRYSGSGDANDPASWGAATDIGYAEYMHLASGPSGLFLKQVTADNKIEVRKFDGVTFGAGVAIPDAIGGELAQSHMTQDPAGRLHAVWPTTGTAEGMSFTHSTSDDGATWQTQNVVTGSESIVSMRAAVAADHVGVAVWGARRLAKPEVPAEQIRVVALRPAPRK